MSHLEEVPLESETSGPYPGVSMPITHVAAASPEDLRRRYFWLIAVGMLCTAFTNPGGAGIGGQPLKYLLKTQLHLQPKAMAAFFALAALAFYFKPIVGLLTDGIPLFGTRRRGYLLVSALGAGVCWLLLAFVPRTYHALLYTVMLLNVFLMGVSTVVGGLLVEAGQRYHATGRYTSLRSSIYSVSYFAVGPLAGYLATRPLLLTSLVGCTVPFALALGAFLLLRERPVATRNRDVGRNLAAQFRNIARYRPLGGAVLAYFLYYFAPGWHTPLFFYQTNTLKLSQQFIGNLGMISGVMGLLGAACYALLCRRLPMRTLLLTCITLTMIGTSCYHFYTSHFNAAVVEGIAGFFGALAELSLLDLAARATPRGSEGLGYALMLSIHNAATSGGDVLGSHLFEKYHLTFLNLIWLNVGTTGLVLLLIPFLPRTLMRSRDGDSAPPESESAQAEILGDGNA